MLTTMISVKTILGFAFLATVTLINSIEGRNLRNSTRAIYYNPVADFGWADPHVYHHTDGWYYMPRSEDNGVALYRSRSLTNWRNAERNFVYQAGPGLGAVWAPEVHFIAGRFYIYVAMETGGDNRNHRMYVIQSNNPTNPMGGWSTAYRVVVPEEDFWAIDATVLQYGDGRLYFIWSGWPAIDSDFPQNLYIAQMCDPVRICGNRVLIKTVDYPWEQNAAPLIEGPQVLQHEGRTFIIYSASGSWTADYNLGMMGIDDLKNPLVYDNWWRHDQPVFWRNDETSVYGTGHASFTTTTSESGEIESWIMYHAMEAPDAGWEGRTARVERFGWNPDNSPAFPRPSGFGTGLEGPSGED